MKSGASDIITHYPNSVESRTVFVGTPRNIGRIQDVASQPEDQALAKLLAGSASAASLTCNPCTNCLN